MVSLWTGDRDDVDQDVAVSELIALAARPEVTLVSIAPGPSITSGPYTGVSYWYGKLCSASTGWAPSDGNKDSSKTCDMWDTPTPDLRLSQWKALVLHTGTAEASSHGGLAGVGRRQRMLAPAGFCLLLTPAPAVGPRPGAGVEGCGAISGRPAVERRIDANSETGSYN